MKILVLIKQVPDTGQPRKLSAETGLLDRAATEALADEINERAMECALEFKDSHGDVEVVVVTAGAPEVNKALRRMLSMGADRAIQLSDEAMAGADMLQTAKALTAAIQNEGFDLLIAGNQSTDGRGGMVPAMIAEMLDVPLLPDLENVEITDTKVRGTIQIPPRNLSLEAELPAVISVTERAAEPRFPTFKGIMAAKKKPLAQIGLAELGTQAGPAYAPSRSVMVSAVTAPQKQAGQKIVDEGTAAVQLVDFLEAQNLL